jgi:hypothetical protein
LSGSGRRKKEFFSITRTREPRGSPGRPGQIIGTLAISGAMNALSLNIAQGLMLWRAIGLGLALPALVYALTRAGAMLYIQRS